MPDGTALLLVNRQARKGRADLEACIEVLGRGGAPIVMDLPARDELQRRVAEAVARGVRRIVTAGGDGTVNAVLPAVLETGLPLGVLPLGTANDLARTLGLPSDPVAAAEVIMAGRTRRIDVGRVNDRLFVNAAGIGFSADLHRELDPKLKRGLGPLAYPVAIVRRWRRRRTFAVSIRAKGFAVSRRALQVTIANGRFYGGGMAAAADARLDDGQLDVLVVLPRPWWRFAKEASSFKRGVFTGDAPVLVRRAPAVLVVTGRPLPVATDGEIAASTPATFAVLPAAMEVYVPDDAPEG